MNQALIETAPPPAAWAPGAGPFDSGARFLPAYRRFAAGHSLRQSIVFPGGDTGNRPTLQRKTAALSRNGYRGAAKLVEKEFLSEEQIGAMDQCFSTLNICLRWEASKAQRNPQPLAGAMPLLDKLIAELSLARLREVARRWRTANLAAQARYAEKMARPKERASWAPLIAESIVIGGLRFRELTTAAALDAEGQRMKHCVGTYAPTCAAGRTHIFSCTAPSGAPLSTLEIRLARDRTGAVAPNIMQHHGPQDASAPLECSEAAKALIGLLCEEPHRSRMAALQELSARPGEVPRFQGMTVAQIQCAVEAFRSILSGKMAYERLVKEALKFHAPRPGVNGAAP